MMEARRPDLVLVDKKEEVVKLFILQLLEIVGLRGRRKIR